MFTIIIPCFNEVDTLRKTLAGLAAQAHNSPPFEVILVDNNSDRQSPDAAYRDYVKHMALYLLRQPILAHTFALARARNLGMRLARFPWIITIDSDCVPNPNYLCRLAKTIEASDGDNALMTGERVFVDGAGLDEGMIVSNVQALEQAPQVRSTSNYLCPRDRRFPDLLTLDESPHPWAFIHGGNTIFQRALGLACGGYDERYDGCWGYEDVEFAHRMITAGARPRYVDGAHVFHLERPGDEIERGDKRNNPNWQRIKATIPGFAEFKADQFRRLGAKINL